MGNSNSISTNSKAAPVVFSEASACGLTVYADPRFLGTREIWPSARVLTTAMQSGLVEVRDQTVLELGAGLALPSFQAAKAGARHVYVSDREEVHAVFDRNRSRLGEEVFVCQFLELDWADTDSILPDNIDLILGADIVYYEEQDALVGLLDRLLSSGERTFVLAYRERTDLDRKFLQEMLLGRYECTRREQQENVELYWFRGRRQ